MLKKIAQAVCAFKRSSHTRRHSELYIIDDGANWALKQEALELSKIAGRLRVGAQIYRNALGVIRQNIFFCSHFVLCKGLPLSILGNRIAMSYFHGKPRPDHPEFEACFQALKRAHEKISRIQVSHSEANEIVLDTGIDPDKVRLIPIGINLGFFPQRTPELCRASRERYGIPLSATVIGSFQKDGNGWGEGLTPKFIKGPDIFLETLKLLQGRFKELFVLLSGPARGYVKRGLADLGIPFKHVFLENYPDIGELYQALDLYLVTSRQEGGPKAVLESMASGVPLVTTRVGQAIDLVRHGENGWMVDVGDTEGLAHWAGYVMEHKAGLGPVLEKAAGTARENSYDSQIPLWENFFDGMVSKT